MRVPTAERQVSKNLGNIPKLPSINTGGPTAYGVGVGQAGVELAGTVSNVANKLVKQREANKKREDAALNARLLNDYKNSSNDFLYSNDTITKNIGGVDYDMPKGIMNRTEWQSKGTTKEWEDFYTNNQNDLLEKSNDPESLFYELEANNQSKIPKIGMREVAQSKADQDNSYKTIVGRAINDAYEGGTVKELNVLFDEAEKYQKELDPDGVEDVFNKIADKAVSGAIMRDPSGFEANALLLGMEKKIGKEQRNKLQTSIDKKTSTMRKNLKTQEKKQQYVVGTDLVNKLSNNEIGLSDEESIKDMGVKREISQELTNAVIKTIYNPISEFDDEGKDAAFTDLVKAIISDTDIDRKNKNLVDILNGFTGGDLSQRRMQLLVQTAAEMGIGVEAGDTKKVEYKQNMDAIWEWSEEAGIDKSNMTEDLLESMMQEYDPKTVLEEIKLKEIERQNNSKEKEIKLDKQLSGEILKNFSTGTSLTDVSEKSLYQYLLKSGQEKNEAAATAQEVFNSEDANDIADKMAQAVPEIKYSMPETQQAVKNYNLFTEVVDFLDPKAYAGETEGNDYYNKLLDYEGLETEVYDDSKGIPTIGIGHKIKEGEDFDGYTEDDFKDLFNTKDLPEHLDRTKELINNFDELPLELRKEIVASVYRGGLSGSLETIKLINDGKYKAAAEEFLDNDEYREAKQWEIDNKEPHGVVRRMDNLVNELNNMGEDRLSLLEGLDNLFFTNAQAAETYTEENRYSPERKESIGNTIGNFFEYSFGQPMHSTNAAVQNSFGRMLYPIGEAYDFYLDKLNIGDKTLPRGLQTAAQSYFKIAEEERKKGIVADDAISKITRGLYEGTGALMMKLPVYAAVGAGLGPLASTSMGVVEFTEASPGGTGEAVSAGVKGLAFQQFVKGISLLPRTIQLPTAFTSFAGATALDGGSIEDSVASGVLGVGLSLSGRAPTMSQFRSRYAKNPGMLGEILKHTKSLMKQKSVADYNLWQKDATKTLGKFNSKKAMKSEIETFFKENKIAYNDAKVNSVINDIRNLWSKQVSTANARKTGGLKLLTPRELLGEGIKFERTMKSKIAQEFAKDTPVAESVQNNIKNDVLIDAVQGQTASSKKPITSVKNGEYRVDINPTSSLESGRKGDILIYKEGSAKPVNAGYWMDKSETNDPKYDDLPIEERAQIEAQIQLDKYAEFDFKDRWLEENDFDVHTDIGLNHNWNRDSKGYKAAVIKAFNKSYEDDAQPEQAEVANKVDKVAPPVKPPVDKAVAEGAPEEPENIKGEKITIGSMAKIGKSEKPRNLEKEVEERIKKQGEKISDVELKKIREENLLGKETIDEIIVRKRGIITDKEAVERAKRMKGTIDDVLNIPKGTVPNKEQMTAISQIVQQEREINKSIIDLAEKGMVGSTPEERVLIENLKGGQLTEEEALQQALEESTIKLRKAEIVLFAAKSEAGRALQGAKQSIDAVDSRLRIALSKMKKLPILDRQAMTEELSKIHLDDNNEFIKFLDKINTSDWFDKFGEWATAIKLYNPTTHMVNFGSNAARQVVDMGITSLSSPKYALADAQGMMVGLKQGIKNSIRALTDEGYASQLSKYIEEGGLAPAINGNIGKWVRTSFRMLGAGDEVFKAIAYQRSLYRQAARMTNNNPEEMKALLERPTFEMMDEATEIAKRMTYQEDMGEIAKAINKFRTPSNFKNVVSKSASLLTRIFVPFLKTPMNLAKQAVDISPLGLVKNQKLLKEAVKNGDDETVKRIFGEAIFGSLLMAGVALLSLDGRITGGTPRGKKERDQFYREKKLPYAIKVGDTWYQYKRVDPMSTVVGITADTITLAKEEDFNVGGLADLVSQNLEDKTFLRGINDLMSLTTGDPWERENAINNAVIGSTIPSLIGHIARTVDPKIRATDNILDKAKSQIPFLSKTLPPRVNVLGTEIERSNKGLTYFFSPIQSQDAEIDPITKELSDIGYNIPLPASYFTKNKVKYKLDKKDYYNFSKYVGERLAEKIAYNMGLRNYDSKSTENKIKKIEKDRSNIMDDWKEMYAESKNPGQSKRNPAKF